MSIDSFILKHRVYCEFCAAPVPATRVVKVRKHPKWPETERKCVCDAHARAFLPIETGLRDRARLEQEAKWTPNLERF